MFRQKIMDRRIKFICPFDLAEHQGVEPWHRSPGLSHFECDLLRPLEYISILFHYKAQRLPGQEKKQYFLSLLSDLFFQISPHYISKISNIMNICKIFSKNFFLCLQIFFLSCKHTQYGNFSVSQLSNLPCCILYSILQTIRNLFLFFLFPIYRILASCHHIIRFPVT